MIHENTSDAYPTYSKTEKSHSKKLNYENALQRMKELLILNQIH